jgi:hypothetical protein
MVDKEKILFISLLRATDPRYPLKRAKFDPELLAGLRIDFLKMGSSELQLAVLSGRPLLLHLTIALNTLDRRQQTERIDVANRINFPNRFFIINKI